MDPVAAFVLRTEKLEPVLQALKKLVKDLPPDVEIPLENS